MTEISKYNNISAQLPVGGGFIGRIESTGVYNAITVNILISQPSIVTVYQFPTSQSPLSSYSNIFEQSVTENEQTTFQVPVVSPWFNLVVRNISGVAVNITANSYLQEQTATCVIDAIQAGGGGYVLPTASETVLGGVKIDGTSITIADGVISATGGGGDASQWATFPSVSNVDMDSHKIIGITELTGVGTYSDPIIVNNDLQFTGTGLGIGGRITDVDYIDGTTTGGGMSITNVGNIAGADGQLLLNADRVIISRLLRFNDNGTEQTEAYNNPFQVDLDMNNHALMNVNGIGAIANKGQTLTADKTVYIASNLESVLLSSKTSIISAIPPSVVQFPPLPTKSLTYDVNGDLTFDEGTQNINNPLGTTTSKNFTLTAGGAGKIVFSDLTEMTTASGGGGGFVNPAIVDLDMNTHKIIGITELTGVGTYNDPIIVNNNIEFAGSPEFGSGTQIENLEYLVGNVVNGLTLTNVAEIRSEPYNNELIINVAKTTLGGNLKFNQDATEQTTAYQNPFLVNLDMNGNKIINTTELNSGTYNALVIDSSPITNDGTILIQNNYQVGGANTTPASIFYMSADGITLQNYANGRSGGFKSVNFEMDGTFRAPQFKTIGLVSGVGLDLTDSSISGASSIKFADLSVQDTAYTGDDVKTITSTDGSVTITTPSANTVNLSVPTPQVITSNTFYINDNVGPQINDVLPLMANGDIAIMSAGSFGQATDITWNKAQTGLSGSVAPIPLTFLTTANASRFTVTASQVRVANIKFQLPVFLSGNSCTVDNCDFDSALTIGTGVSSYITINNCEFAGTQTITVASTFTNVCYFINCNFASSTFSLLNPSSSQVIFNNCAGFTTYPANATYVGINVLSAGSAQLSTNDLKSVSGTLRLTSGLNVNGQAFTNVNSMAPATSGQISFTNGLNIPSGSLNMRFNNIFNAGTITWTTGLTTIASASATRNLYTLSIPAFVSGANANFVFNDLGTLSLKNATLTTGGVITYPDTTTSNSGLVKGSGTLVAGLLTILDARVTTGAICVATYADSSPVGGVLCAKVTAGQIVIESKLITDVSPVFYMYFI